MPRCGALAERLGRGLQSLVRRFESARLLDSHGTSRVSRESATDARLRARAAARHRKSGLDFSRGTQTIGTASHVRATFIGIAEMSVLSRAGRSWLAG